MTRYPLGGVDVFHLRGDRDSRRAGLAGNACAIALELDGRVDLAKLEARVTELARALPELTVALDERPAIFGGPAWRPTGRAPAVHRGASRRPLAEAALALLASRVGGEAPLAVHVLDRGQRDAVVLAWFHPLTDARGASRLLARLGDETPPARGAPVFATSDNALAGLPIREQLELAGAYKAHALGLGGPEKRIATAATGVPRAGRAGHVGTARVRVLELSEEDTRRFDQRVRKTAKLAETATVVLAAARALDAVLKRRGAAEATRGRYVVPVPLSFDPKGSELDPRVLGNNLTMLLFALERADLDPAREREAFAKLAEAQRAIAKNKLDVAMIAALKLTRALPDVAATWIATRPFGGAAASLVVSNPGAVAGAAWQGLPVLEARAVPTVVPSPGLQVIATRHAKRFAATVVSLDGLLTETEASRFDAALGAALLGEPTPAAC